MGRRGDSGLEAGKSRSSRYQQRTRQVRVLLDEPGPRAGPAITAGDIEDLARRAGRAVVADADPAEILMDRRGRRLRVGVDWRQAALAASRCQHRKRKSRNPGASHEAEAARSSASPQLA